MYRGARQSPAKSILRYYSSSLLAKLGVDSGPRSHRLPLCSISACLLRQDRSCETRYPTRMSTSRRRPQHVHTDFRCPAVYIRYCGCPGFAPCSLASVKVSACVIVGWRPGGDWERRHSCLSSLWRFDRSAVGMPSVVNRVCTGQYHQ